MGFFDKMLTLTGKLSTAYDDVLKASPKIASAVDKIQKTAQAYPKLTKAGAIIGTLGIAGLAGSAFSNEDLSVRIFEVMKKMLADNKVGEVGPPDSETMIRLAVDRINLDSDMYDEMQRTNNSGVYDHYNQLIDHINTLKAFNTALGPNGLQFDIDMPSPPNNARSAQMSQQPPMGSTAMGIPPPPGMPLGSNSPYGVSPQQFSPPVQMSEMQMSMGYAPPPSSQSMAGILGGGSNLGATSGNALNDALNFITAYKAKVNELVTILRLTSSDDVSRVISLLQELSKLDKDTLDLISKGRNR